jgi:predicted nuclease with TOPRIM domain
LSFSSLSFLFQKNISAARERCIELEKKVEALEERVKSQPDQEKLKEKMTELEVIFFFASQTNIFSP